MLPSHKLVEMSPYANSTKLVSLSNQSSTPSISSIHGLFISFIRLTSCHDFNNGLNFVLLFLLNLVIVVS